VCLYAGFSAILVKFCVEIRSLELGRSDRPYIESKESDCWDFEENHSRKFLGCHGRDKIHAGED